MIVETLSILKRFAALPELEPASGTLDELRLHRALTTLLATRDALVLQCVLVAMYHFVQVEKLMDGRIYAKMNRRNFQKRKKLSLENMNRGNESW